MNGESKAGLPTSLTPYALGAGVLVLIAVFSLMASVPWANKAEIEALKGYIKGEVEWIKQQQASTQRQVDSIEVDRRERGSALAEIKAGREEVNRRLLRLEDMASRRAGRPMAQPGEHE